eukprot:COSAG01_NODE_3584_length_5909_cov_6.177281_2_plen_708_part_00
MPGRAAAASARQQHHQRYHPRPQMPASSRPLIDGRYKVLREVGKGAFSDVYLAEARSGGKYALKRLNTAAKNEIIAARKEVGVMQAVRHFHVIRCHEMFMHEERLYIAMDYADAGDLYGLIDRQRRAQRQHVTPSDRARLASGSRYFLEQTVMSWFIQLCVGLKHCHDCKVMHRDIKSKNILLFENCRFTGGFVLKLGDFGLAKAVKTTDQYLAKTTCGTPINMSPELMQNQQYSFAADVWALGTVLHELCALVPPFVAANMKDLRRAVVMKPAAALPSCYSSSLRELVGAMLNKSGQARPSINGVLRTPIVRRTLRETLASQRLQPVRRHRERIVHLDDADDDAPACAPPAAPKHGADVGPAPPQTTPAAANPKQKGNEEGHRGRADVDRARRQAQAAAIKCQDPRYWQPPPTPKKAQPIDPGSVAVASINTRQKKAAAFAERVRREHAARAPEGRTPTHPSRHPQQMVLEKDKRGVASVPRHHPVATSAAIPQQTPHDIEADGSVRMGCPSGVPPPQPRSAWGGAHAAAPDAKLLVGKLCGGAMEREERGREPATQTEAAPGASDNDVLEEDKAAIEFLNSIHHVLTQQEPHVETGEQQHATDHDQRRAEAGGGGGPAHAVGAPTGQRFHTVAEPSQLREYLSSVLGHDKFLGAYFLLKESRNHTNTLKVNAVISRVVNNLLGGDVVTRTKLETLAELEAHEWSC